MGSSRLTRKFEHQGVLPISNKTVMNTYETVRMDKFFTKGINNRDNARWKRAQYIVVEGCPFTSVNACLDGFFEFAEGCQYIIFEDLDIAYDGRKCKVTIDNIFERL